MASTSGQNFYFASLNQLQISFSISIFAKYRNIKRERCAKLYLKLYLALVNHHLLSILLSVGGLCFPPRPSIEDGRQTDFITTASPAHQPAKMPTYTPSEWPSAPNAPSSTSRNALSRQLQPTPISEAEFETQPPSPPSLAAPFHQITPISASDFETQPPPTAQLPASHRSQPIFVYDLTTGLSTKINEGAEQSLQGCKRKIGEIEIWRGVSKGFTENEILALAKAWIEQSGKGCNQSEKSMWSGIKSICQAKYNVRRTASSLRS